MSKISLVIAREFNQRVKKRTFILTTILMPVLMAALMIIPGLMMVLDNAPQREIIVIDPIGQIAPKMASLDKLTITPTTLSYEEAIKSHPDSYGFLILSDNSINNPTDLELYTRESVTFDVENELKAQVRNIVYNHRIAQSGVDNLAEIVQSLRPETTMATYTIGDTTGPSEGEAKESSTALSMGIAYVTGFALYMFILLYGTMVMQGVIEEKSNRIIEVMISSIKPFQLMMGKIIGIGLTALTQVGIWIVLGVIGMLVAQSFIPGAGAGSESMDAIAAANNIPSEFTGVLNALSDPAYIWGIVGMFVLYFLGGYLLYASMFAAVGSAVDNIQDSQQLQIPVTIPIIFALVIMMAVIKEPSSSIAFWFSLVPFTSPIIMMARIPYGVPMWEVITSLVILYGSFIIMTKFAAKIYRIGIFMYGKKPSLKEILKWSRYKY